MKLGQYLHKLSGDYSENVNWYGSYQMIDVNLSIGTYLTKAIKDNWSKLKKAKKTTKSEMYGQNGTQIYDRKYLNPVGSFTLLGASLMCSKKREQRDG